MEININLAAAFSFSKVEKKEMIFLSDSGLEEGFHLRYNIADIGVPKHESVVVEILSQAGRYKESVTNKRMAQKLQIRQQVVL